MACGTGGEDRQRTGEMLVVHAKCTAQLHAFATRNVEISGCGNWGVLSMKTPSLGNNACTRIGSCQPSSSVLKGIRYIPTGVQPNAWVYGEVYGNLAKTSSSESEVTTLRGPR